MRYAKVKDISDKGQRMNTIHQGAMLPGCIPLSVLPQYHNAAIQICCEPCTTHARSVQTSVAAPYQTEHVRYIQSKRQGQRSPLPLQSSTQRRQTQQPTKRHKTR